MLQFCKLFSRNCGLVAVKCRNDCGRKQLNFNLVAEFSFLCCTEYQCLRGDDTVRNGVSSSVESSDTRSTDGLTRFGTRFYSQTRLNVLYVFVHAQFNRKIVRNFYTPVYTGRRQDENFGEGPICRMYCVQNSSRLYNFKLVKSLLMS